MENNGGSIIGFFGDHWQKIYGSGCGKIEHINLEEIGKEANFRSAPIIVDSLNLIRPDLPQQVCDPDAQGTVDIFHTNNWVGERLTGNHWKGDLPGEISHEYLNNLKSRLEKEGWDLTPDKTKILMLTHNVLALEQGYKSLAEVFRYKESFIKKEDIHIAFFIDILEPVCKAYEKGCFGQMFTLLGRRTPLLTSKEDKDAWVRDMDILIALRQSGTVGEVLDHLLQKKRPRLPEGVENKECKLTEWLQGQEPEENRKLLELKKLRAVSYGEVVALSNFLNDSTPFNTKHGVKGAEFENVLVVFGRGWNQYNFNQFLEWVEVGVPADKGPSFERNRNLFYVVCSRSKIRLCLLFTQELSDNALKTLSNWFGVDSIKAL